MSFDPTIEAGAYQAAVDSIHRRLLEDLPGADPHWRHELSRVLAFRAVNTYKRVKAGAEPPGATAPLLLRWRRRMWMDRQRRGEREP